MTGFIYEPKSPYTLREWEEGLGNRFDADQWVRDFKEAGARYLIFYDKWIDGFAFHDTDTTGYKTHRDFVREIAEACHRHSLRLVFYFNAMTDGNPEFERWSLIGPDGNPLVFAPAWPTRVQTLHSPFRDVSLQQVRELFTRYGRVDGMWLDIFGDRGLESTSEFVPRAFEKMFGQPLDQATPAQRAEFSLRTLADYLEEVRAMAREHQPGCVWTANGSTWAAIGSNPWAKWVGSRLDYFSSEGHQQPEIGRLARLARLCGKPTEIGELLSTTWFTPRGDEPPPPSKTPAQALAEVAEMIGRGASVYLALTPNHAGTFGDDLKVAKAVGAWFRQVEPVLTNARPCADIGIALGTPSLDGPGLPYANSLWTRFGADQRSAIEEALAMSDTLEETGFLTELLFALDGRGSWPESLAGYRAVIVPEVALLDEEHLQQLREYVREGGNLIAFAHASLLDGRGARRATAAWEEVLGVQWEGEVEFPAEAFPAMVYVDSVYATQFPGLNLIDDAPTFWASAETPMPHWAQINLPVPVDIAQVEVVSREGPYLITDIDVETYDGQEWHVVKSIRGADTQTIPVSFDPPLREQYVRLTVWGELYGGEARPIADIEAIRVFDPAGRNWASGRARRFPLTEVSPQLAGAAGETPLSFAPMAVQVQPTTAEVLARLEMEGRPPAVLRNRFGEGTALLVTTSEASFRGDAAFWSRLLNLAVGEPTVRCEDTSRYCLILSQTEEKSLLHVIDRDAGRPDYAPAKVALSLDAERLGNPTTASLIGGHGLPLSRDGARLRLELRPDPVASVTLPFEP